MHQVILDRLEEYLSGSPSSQAFTAHLESCEACRTEVREMQELSTALVALRAPQDVTPPPGFYARVSRRVDQQRPRSIWSLCLLDPAFGKRVAFASLMTLAVLGSYLITRETDYAAGPTNATAVMAERGPSENPDVMLATLASYEP
jgi:anti-sigma factor RsiW